MVIPRKKHLNTGLFVVCVREKKELNNSAKRTAFYIISLGLTVSDGLKVLVVKVVKTAHKPNDSK